LNITTSGPSLLVRLHACTCVCVRVCVNVCGVCVSMCVCTHACLGVLFDPLYAIKSIVFQSRNKTIFCIQTSTSFLVLQKIQIFQVLNTDSYIIVNFSSIAKKFNTLPPNLDNLYTPGHLAHCGVGLKPSAGSVPTKQRVHSRFVFGCPPCTSSSERSHEIQLVGSYEKFWTTLRKAYVRTASYT